MVAKKKIVNSLFVVLIGFCSTLFSYDVDLKSLTAEYENVRVVDVKCRFNEKLRSSKYYMFLENKSVGSIVEKGEEYKCIRSSSLIDESVSAYTHMGVTMALVNSKGEELKNSVQEQIVFNVIVFVFLIFPLIAIWNGVYRYWSGKDSGLAGVPLILYVLGKKKVIE